MKITSCFFLLFFCAAMVSAQKPGTTLRGRLLDASGNTPLSGATIMTKQAQSKFTSSSDGTFSISLSSETDTLLISHVNYTPVKLPVKASMSQPLLIRMSISEKQLSEVLVSTGYQSVPKERATGSFESISNTKFNEQVGTTVLSRLEAIAGGLYVDKKTNAGIVIRGLSTIQGPKGPLVILDDFPYDGDLNNINPNDVENIGILRDAAAASIWGTRAGNGVIVITTKKGKFNQPLRISINNNISITDKPDLFYMKNMGTSDFIDVEQFLYSKGYYNSMLNSNSKPPVSPVVELLVKKANGTIPAAEADTRINQLRELDVRNDFNEYMYRTAVSRQHAMNIQAGSGAAALSFSAGLDVNIGSLDDRYNRITIRSANTFRLSQIFQLNAGIIFTQVNTTAGKPGYNEVATANGKIPPYTMLADADGNALSVIKDYRQAYLDTAGAGKLLNWNYYPLTDYRQVSNKQNTAGLLTTVGLNTRLWKGLTADIKYQFEQQETESNLTYYQDSYFARNLINMYSQLNRTTGVVTYKVPKGAIRATKDQRMVSQSVRAQLNFSRRFTLWEVNAIAGTEIRQVTNNSHSARIYGFNPDILTYGLVDFTTAYPGFINGSTSYIPDGLDVSSTIKRFVSVYGNASATYKNRYTVSASARRDASNLFGINTNEKWTPLWSTGLAWNISKENFYSCRLIPDLRLRLSYGVSGNADPDRSALTTIFYLSGNSPYTLTPTARIEQFANPSLRWEKVYMLNIGADFKTKNNRITGSVEYYQKKATDLFASSPVDYTAVATTFMVKNVATVQGRGFDFSLSSINIKKTLTWSTDFNLSYNQDKVKDYYRGNNQGSNVVGGGTIISAVQGKPVYALYAYRWAGLDPSTGDPLGYINGQSSKDYASLTGSSTLVSDLVYIGPARPRLFGSMGNSFSWKNLSVTVRLSYKFGYYIKQNSINYSLLFANRNGHSDYAKRWQKPGDEQFTSIPSMTYPASTNRDNFYNNAEILMHKGDHIRLQYITLSYTSNKTFWIIPFRSVQFYLNLNCPKILWRANKYGIDPDYSETTILPSNTCSAGLKAEF